MVTADVEEMSRDLGKYLERVKGGEQVVVTEGGQPIARLEPVAPSNETEEERIENLYAAGIMRRGDPTPLPADFWYDQVDDPEGLVLKAVLEERESGWWNSGTRRRLCRCSSVSR
jgi:prevent-host-death family protein